MPKHTPARQCILGCQSSDNLVSLFQFPKNAEMRMKWLSFVKSHSVGEETIATSSHLCSQHFSPESFSNLQRRLLGLTNKPLALVNSAEPTISPGLHSNVTPAPSSTGANTASVPSTVCANTALFKEVPDEVTKEHGKILSLEEPGPDVPLQTLPSPGPSATVSIGFSLPCGGTACEDASQTQVIPAALSTDREVAPTTSEDTQRRNVSGPVRETGSSDVSLYNEETVGSLLSLAGSESDSTQPPGEAGCTVTTRLNIIKLEVDDMEQMEEEAEEDKRTIVRQDCTDSKPSIVNAGPAAKDNPGVLQNGVRRRQRGELEKVEVKDEPVDEGYDKALAPTNAASEHVKDEPETEEDNLKISAVFSVGGASSPNASPVLTSAQAQARDQDSSDPHLVPSSMCMACSGCKKSVTGGLTAYQKKSSSHLFCSTKCLTSYSPAPSLLINPLGERTCHYCLKEVQNPKDWIKYPVDTSRTLKDFCGQACLSSFNVKRNSAMSTLSSSSTPALITRAVECESCRQRKVPAYHLAMSDSSIRNFCTLTCVLTFQCPSPLLLLWVPRWPTVPTQSSLTWSRLLAHQLGNRMCLPTLPCKVLFPAHPRRSLIM